MPVTPISSSPAWERRLPKESIYIDSCIWIAQYKPDELTDEQRSGISWLNEQISMGNVIAVASSLLLVELLTVSAELIEIAYDGRKGLLVAADDAICHRARELQQKCYADKQKCLSNLDALHLSTASVQRCQRFLTLDKTRKNNQLSPLADKQYLERLLGLKIVDPTTLEDQKKLDL